MVYPDAESPYLEPETFQGQIRWSAFCGICRQQLQRPEPSSICKIGMCTWQPVREYRRFARWAERWENGARAG